MSASPGGGAPTAAQRDSPDFASIPELLRVGVVAAWQLFQENATPELLAGLARSDLAWRETLPKVWGASNFVANACARDPGLLQDLLRSGDLQATAAGGGLNAKVTAAVDEAVDEKALARALRRIRRREMVRIAWRDLAGWAAVEETMQNVSILAEVCIDNALRRLHGWQVERHGEPLGRQTGAPVRMVVLGLGKLGGGELNYSSDIDLIFAYPEEGETEGERTLDNHQFFLRLGQALIRVLDQVTADGFVFRTDMRLRPNGNSGPLVLSFGAMENYYQTHGRDWERYALIKGRVVGGDRIVGANLLDVLRPFVYRKYLDFGAFESIRAMKEMIERELLRKGMEGNIKLGRGGIREIEFLAQSYQLIRGGRERTLQTYSLYQALTVLLQLGILDAEVVAELLDAYRFLRNSEHRLQMVDDRQTQLLPKEEDECLRLAWAMGYPDWEAYRSALEVHRSVVHRSFSAIMEKPEQEQSEPALGALIDLWAGVSDDPQAALRAAGFDQPEPTLQLLQQLKQGNMYHSYSNFGRDRLDRILPLAIAEAGRLPESARAIRHFVSIVESIGRRSAYLSLLAENPLALTQLLRLSAASPWISQWIGRHPVVLDELIRPIEDPAKLSRQRLATQLQERSERSDLDDLELQMDLLREFHHGQELRIAAADVIEHLAVERVGGALSALAEAILERAEAIAASGIRQRYGIPMLTAAETERPAESGVIAYGKLGSGELGYNSDLDIVFLFESEAGGRTHGGDKETSIEHYYSRLGQRLVHILTTRTHAGLLYEIDMRLRPSGGKGTLVTSLTAFRDYQLQKAWTWEHQALVRARLATGAQALSDRFESVRREVLCRPRDNAALQGEIRAMRDKMIRANCQSDDTYYDVKLDRGGLVDIEFLLQYRVLRHAAGQAAVIEPRDTAGIVNGLMAEGLVSKEEGATLIQSYRTYLRKIFDLKLLDRPPLIRQEELREERAAVVAIWQAWLGG